LCWCALLEGKAVRKESRRTLFFNIRLVPRETLLPFGGRLIGFSGTSNDFAESKLAVNAAVDR